MDKNSSLPLPGVPGMDKPFFQHHSGVTEAPLFFFFQLFSFCLFSQHLAVANRRKFGATRSHEESILKNKVTEWETNSLWVQGSAEMIGPG